MIKSKEKTKLDINFVKSQFPTFQEELQRLEFL